MKKVRKIEMPEKQEESRKLKVTAYCRVSTKYDSQKSSIELQVEYYTKYIEEQADWECAGIYMILIWESFQRRSSLKLLVK